MQYRHDDGALLIFHPEDPKWTKELFTYSFNYNFKVGHEPWTCVNPLRLTNPRNPTKRLVSQRMFIIFFLVLMNHICVHYSLIGL
jgi:hypothetical protein